MVIILGYGNDTRYYGTTGLIKYIFEDLDCEFDQLGTKVNRACVTLSTGHVNKLL